MKTNSHFAHFTFPAPALQAFDAGLTAAEDNSTVLPVADPAQLKHLARMGRKTESFSREALALAKLNPDLLPKGLDVEQAEAAMANRDLLLSRFQRVKRLAARLDYALSLLGVDAFDAARAAYKSMKINTRDAALLEALDDLGRTFRAKHLEETVSTGKSAGNDTSEDDDV